MSVAHSKSAIPAEVLNDRVALRRVLQRVIFTGLDDHRAAKQLPQAADTSPMPADANTDAYDDPSQSFAWLTAPNGPQAELADDVVDALRALRAADVLRQRGTVLRTSGGFEICMDAETARAVCTLRPATGDAAYVIIYDDDRGAGEANISAAFVTPQGHLRIAFHRGAFGSEDAAQRAAASVATSSSTSRRTSSRPSAATRSGAGCTPRPARSTTSRSSSSGPTTGPASPTMSRRSWPIATPRSPGDS